MELQGCCGPVGGGYKGLPILTRDAKPILITMVVPDPPLC